jgi:hypothetical protein
MLAVVRTLESLARSKRYKTVIIPSVDAVSSAFHEAPDSCKNNHIPSTARLARNFSPPLGELRKCRETLLRELHKASPSYRNTISEVVIPVVQHYARHVFLNQRCTEAHARIQHSLSTLSHTSSSNSPNSDTNFPPPCMPSSQHPGSPNNHKRPATLNVKPLQVTGEIIRDTLTSHFPRIS